MNILWWPDQLNKMSENGQNWFMSFHLTPYYTGRIWHKDNFVSGVKVICIQSFTFPRTVFRKKAKQPTLPWYLRIAEGWRHSFMPFLQAISAKWNAKKHVQNLNQGLCVYCPRWWWLLDHRPPKEISESKLFNSGKTYKHTELIYKLFLFR